MLTFISLISLCINVEKQCLVLVNLSKVYILCHVPLCTTAVFRRVSTLWNICPVRPYAGWILMKFDTEEFYGKYSRSHSF
jgi:hypothetical protein